MTDALTFDHNHGRFRLGQFEDGAVLLDLETGTFYRLNPVAVRVFEELAQGQTAAEAAQIIATSFGIPLASAQRDVETLIEQLGQTHQPVSSNPIRFRSNSDGHVLCWQGEDFWHVDRQGRKLTYLADQPVAAPDPVTQLMWIIPHLLLLQQHLVLHAAAVEHADTILALSGSSGQGKSTLARELAREGMNQVADDLLIVQFDHGTPEVAVHGEQFLRSWAATQASTLVAGRTLETDCLAQATAGPRRALGRILFPCRKELSLPIIEERPMGQGAGLLRLLENSFAELGTAEVWRHVWETNRRIVAAIPVAQAVVPEGLPALREAVIAYTRRVKS